MSYFVLLAAIHVYLLTSHAQAQTRDEIQAEIKTQSATEDGWCACVSARWGHTTFPFDDQLKVRAECTPDTLYTWTSLDRIHEFEANAAQSKTLLPIQNTLFLWKTPLGSYGYGDVAMRIKLRSNAVFLPVVLNSTTDMDRKSARDCESLQKRFGKIRNAVYVVRLGDFGDFPQPEWITYHEYLLCSDEAVESWSYGLPEQLVEMKNEKSWIDQHDHSYYTLTPGDPTYDEFTQKGRFSPAPNIIADYDGLIRSYEWSPLWANKTINSQITTHFDHVEWNTINQKFTFMDGLIASSQGKIYYATNIAPDRRQHFSTQHPGYFNKNKSQ